MEPFSLKLIGTLFSLSSKKKIHPEKISYTLIFKTFLYFLKRKLFLYFREWTRRKKILIFSQKKTLLIFRETEAPKNFLYFGNGTF